MSKEKTDSSIELKSIDTDMGKSQNNSISAPAIKVAFMISACAVVMLSGSANNKIITGIKKEVVEYKDNSAGTTSYPFYKVPNKKGNSSTLMQNIIQETKDYELNMYTSDVVSQKIVLDLRKEIMMLKNRLQSSLPVHTLAYMIISSIVGSIAATLVFLRFVGNIYTIDPYYLVCTLIICITLFFTALISLKDWKDFLNERQ